MKEYIKYIIESEGINIIREKRMVFLLDDMGAFNNVPKAVRRILIDIIEDGYAARLFNIGGWNIDTHTLCQRFIDNYGVKDEYATNAFRALGYGFGWEEESIISNNSNNNTVNCQNANKDNLIFTVKGITFEMVEVEGGTFIMGSAIEKYDDDGVITNTPHLVTLGNYMIGKCQVTQELWETVMGSNPSQFVGNKNPVDNVSWDDCQDFIKTINLLLDKQFRLPTEAEWEFAARGGNKSKNYIYSGSDYIDEVAWCIENSSIHTHEVATKQPNELGIFDMSGNVSEWCQDWFESYSNYPQINPKGPNSGLLRVLRGGNCRVCDSFCTTSDRSCQTPDIGFSSLGLRLVLVA